MPETQYTAGKVVVDLVDDWESRRGRADAMAEWTIGEGEKKEDVSGPWAPIVAAQMIVMDYSVTLLGTTLVTLMVKVVRARRVPGLVAAMSWMPRQIRTRTERS